MGLVNGTPPLAYTINRKEHIMSNTTQKQVNTIVSKFLTQQDDLLIGMHSLGLDTPELQRPYVIKAVCEALTAGQGLE
jgi:ATP-dependent RNA circularization protein (DNA/RNA ligase family)